MELGKFAIFKYEHSSAFFKNICYDGQNYKAQLKT